MNIRVGKMALLAVWLYWASLACGDTVITRAGESSSGLQPQ